MESIIRNYHTLQLLWDQAINIIRDTETIARIRGVASQMKSFNYFFGLVLGEILLRHTDNLSRTLQKNISASEGQLVANMTRRTLQSTRNGQQFDLFWEKVKRMAEVMWMILCFLGGRRCLSALKLAVQQQNFQLLQRTTSGGITLMPLTCLFKQ